MRTSNTLLSAALALAAPALFLSETQATAQELLIVEPDFIEGVASAYDGPLYGSLTLVAEIDQAAWIDLHGMTSLDGHVRFLEPLSSTIRLTDGQPRSFEFVIEAAGPGPVVDVIEITYRCRDGGGRNGACGDLDGRQVYSVPVEMYLE